MQARDLLTAFLGAFLALVGMELLKEGFRCLIEILTAIQVEEERRFQAIRAQMIVDEVLGEIREKKDS